MQRLAALHPRDDTVRSRAMALEPTLRTALRIAHLAVLAASSGACSANDESTRASNTSGGGTPTAPTTTVTTTGTTTTSATVVPPTAACDDAVRGQACVNRECGDIETCQGSCGVCPSGEHCVAGQCRFEHCQPGTPDCVCESASISFRTTQTCSINVDPGQDIAGEAFIDVGGPQRVLAMKRWGLGHLIAFCDATTASLVEAVNVEGYLAQTADARIASLGNPSTCEPGVAAGQRLPAEWQYLGSVLPAQYRNDPAKLAADYDAIVFCGFNTEWNQIPRETLAAFVEVHGGGLLAAMDYVSAIDSGVTDYDFGQMNQLLTSAGVSFNAVSLAHADADVSQDIACVADLPPPPVIQ